MAGPFVREDFEKLVPANKRLTSEWLRSLTERGEPTVYRGAELRLIGMPIGGICAGQVYLGGDGKLWHWDVFNRRITTGAEHYAKPLKPACPFDTGFALRVTAEGVVHERALDLSQWDHVTFRGQYPVGRVEYSDPQQPVAVTLEAFSPFIPLNTEDSSLPATVMQFTVFNRGPSEVSVEFAGFLQNPIGLNSAQVRDGILVNRLVREPAFLALECVAEEPSVDPDARRPDIVFEDFERPTYDSWHTGGTAFGNGPVELSRVPEYQGDLGGSGKRSVNSHAGAPGDTVEQRDQATGRLTSRHFKIERRFINFLIGGGPHSGRTCMNLVVEGEVVRTATGQSSNRMRPFVWEVSRWIGRTATLEIVDEETGGWGNVGVDEIVFSDVRSPAKTQLAAEPDIGTFCLALFDPSATDFGLPRIGGQGMPSGLFTRANAASASAREPFGGELIGAIGRELKLTPGASATMSFVVAWHLPNLRIEKLPPGRSYAKRFDSARAVVNYLAQNFERLVRETRLWTQTWYDSSLPYWFLDRTLLNTSILATSTCYRLGNGRFWAWEGVGCCEGTCGHVWQYAHAVARLFPDLERVTREQVDFGSAMQDDGAIHFRGEFNDIPAIDAQAGTVLRALREHQVSADDRFLRRNWPAIRKATLWLIAKDANGDGIIEGNQHNTLDTDWFGPVAWLSGLYLAALSAAETMATEVGDEDFAGKCQKILEVGQRKLVGDLFNGEYFCNRPDPKHPDAINSGSGCHIDQVLGQSWAFQVGLPRVLPAREVLSALKSLWRHNFTPDVGPYRETYKPGRWYAMPGEAGLLMCTFPRSDWNYAEAKGKGPDWAAGYFNECMNGFEYQVAGHMLWEGMVTEGLAITRAVHDRYHPLKRNPWNEVECGDHYARSMASYGVFLAACGFEYHGPKRLIGFAPRLNPRNFKCAFSAAEGWGAYGQQAETNSFRAALDLKYGFLSVGTLRLVPANRAVPASVSVHVRGTPVQAQHRSADGRLEIVFEPEVRVAAGETLTVDIAYS
jgi:uncharacterized protein (DUF608 family)